MPKVGTGNAMHSCQPEDCLVASQIKCQLVACDICLRSILSNADNNAQPAVLTGKRERCWAAAYYWLPLEHVYPLEQQPPEYL